MSRRREHNGDEFVPCSGTRRKCGNARCRKSGDSLRPKAYIKTMNSVMSGLETNNGVSALLKPNPPLHFAFYRWLALSYHVPRSRDKESRWPTANHHNDITTVERRNVACRRGKRLDGKLDLFHGTSL